MVTQLGYLGNTPTAESIINGTYTCPAALSPYAQKLIKAMQVPPDVQVPQSTAYVSTDDHTSAWKRQKERTTGGKSGIHFGMFKAQAQDPTLAAFDASRRSIMYRCGETLDRWKIGVDSMLLKASKDRRAHKMRNVKLIEADCNINYKKIGREGMQNAEQAGLLSPENGGGRRHYRAQEISLNNTLVSDDSRFKRKAMAIISNDAKGCFDRVVHNVAYICLRRFGIPGAPLVSMLKNIQQMDHYIRTAFGDSEDCYNSSGYPHPNQGFLREWGLQHWMGCCC